MGESARVALLTEIPAPFRIPLFNALAAESGIELRVLFLSDRDPKRPHYRVYERESRFDSRVLPRRELVRSGRWVVFNARVIRELVSFDPDVVIVGGWNQPAFWQAALYARVRRRPLVAWVESTASDTRPNAPLLEAAKRMLVRASAGVLVPGRAAAAYVRGLGVGPAAVQVAPNAVDNELFGRRVVELRRERERLRETLGLTRCTFLYVGRLDREKGVDVLVAAVSDLDADLIAVGAGSEQERLRRTAPANVRFLGARDRDELPELYAAVDAFVLPSRSEQWGMVLNEAAAAGLPLVATDAAGAAYDLIENGVNGFRVRVDDVESLRTALRRLATDPELRAAAGARSRATAAGFTGDHWASSVSTLVRRLAADRASRRRWLSC